MCSKKRILIIANSSGGLYNFRRELIEELVKENDIFVSVPLTNSVDELKQLGIELIDTHVDRRGINPICDISLLLKYSSLIKTIKPDLVITYTIKPNIYGAIASRFRHVDYVANITGLGTAFQKKGLLKLAVTTLYKIALKKARTVFFENSENRDYFVNNGLIRGQQGCLLNGAGVNLDRYEYYPYPQSYDQFSFLFMGRVMKEKGLNELFEAMKKLTEEGYSCVLNVLGSYEENYKDAIEDHSNEGWLRYYGYQDDVIPFIRDANCFVLPSWHEGMANTNLECASVGRPIITSNIPGCKEAVIDGVSGYLCEAKNAQSLYEKMKAMIDLPNEIRETMGKAGRKHMEDVFDKRAVVKMTIENLKS